MFDIIFSKSFDKEIRKLQNIEAKIVYKKIIEIQNSKDINKYKNLRNKLKKFKRVHINKSFVMIFRLDKTKNIIYFYRYAHHDKAY